MGTSKQIIFSRTVLLIEIERYCFFPDCKGKVTIGLTKQEAIDYVGFECTLCQRWNEDQLEKRDVPEWWSEIVR
jgi:hypothetical protein